MSAPKFTPGPWVAVRWAETRALTGAVVVIRPEDKGHAPVADVRWPERDAHLIAAAPDLYAACEAMDAAAKGGDWGAAVDAARAALAKARGES